MPLDLPKLLTPKEAAAQLRVSAGTLAVWRCTKRYSLKYIKIGYAIRYLASDVAAFMKSGAAR
jgi:helix-turn-helix protein